MSMDLSVERPPLLYRDADGPPSDAWDVQIAAPTPLAAWLDGHRDRPAASTLFGIGAQRAIATVAGHLRDVPIRWHHHGPHHRTWAAYPHIHVLVGARDIDGRPVARERVEQAATDAWVAHVDRLVDYTSQRPHLGIVWTPTGIAGVDHSGVPEFTCSGFYGDTQPVVVGTP